LFLLLGCLVLVEFIFLLFDPRHYYVEDGTLGIFKLALEQGLVPPKRERVFAELLLDSTQLLVRNGLPVFIGHVLQESFLGGEKLFADLGLLLWLFYLRDFWVGAVQSLDEE
jgi:hypothetical protein